MNTPATNPTDSGTTNGDGIEIANRGPLWLHRYALISRQPFFLGFTPRQIEVLTDDALEMEFEEGQKIFREGDPANRFFLITDGEIVLESELENHGMLPIQTIGPGDDLGWSWLFPPYYLHFSAHAVTSAKAIFFYGTRLRERCEQDHDLGFELMKRVAEVMLQRLQATRRQLSKLANIEPGPPLIP